MCNICIYKNLQKYSKYILIIRGPINTIIDNVSGFLTAIYEYKIETEFET